MAARRSRDRRLQTSGTGACYNHSPPCAGASRRPGTGLRFQPRSRVLGATKRAVAPHAPHALLGARGAEIDRLRAAGERLVGELGVGDLGPYDPDEVAVTCPERTLGLGRVRVAAAADDRERNRLAERRCDETGVPGPEVAGGPGRLRRRLRGTDGSIQVVGATLLVHHRGDGDGVGERRAPVDALVAAEPHPTELRPTAPRPRSGSPGAGGAALERTAVTVGAQVRHRREETAQDRGARALELDPVETPLRALCRHRGEAGDDLGDLVLLDRLGNLAPPGRRRATPPRAHGASTSRSRASRCG